MDASSRRKRSDSKSSKAESPAKAATKSSRVKVQAHRDRLRAQGMRLIQIWVPDVRSAAFAAEAHRQSALVAASPREREEQAFIDSISVDWSDE